MGVKAGRLKDHPNFKPPTKPSGETTYDIIRFTLDYAANLVSPPKVDGEDEDRECSDVARELRSADGDVFEAWVKRND